MIIYEHRLPNAVVLKIFGRLLSKSAHDLGLELARRIDAEEEHVIVDLTHLTSMNSAGLHALLRVSRHCRENSRCQFTLCGCQRRVHEVFQSSALHEEFRAHCSLEEVCSCL